jgi:hypothetical protein
VWDQGILGCIQCQRNKLPVVERTTGMGPKDNAESELAVVELAMTTIGDGNILLHSCCPTEVKAVYNCNTFGV